MTTQQAYTGLRLHENWELADALETYVKGYIDCAKSNGIRYLPDTCAEQAVAFFSLHASWSTNGGGYPWNPIDNAWMNAAMHRLVGHVLDGHSLSDLGLGDGAALGAEQGARGSAAHPSAGDEHEHVGDDEDHDDDDVDAGLPELPGPDANDRAPLPLAAPSSSESPSQRTARTRKAATLVAMSSSSPLSSVPSSILSSDGSIGMGGDGGGGDANTGSSSDASSKGDGATGGRRAHSVARASVTAAPADTAGRGPGHHQYGTRSQQRSRSNNDEDRNNNSNDDDDDVNDNNSNRKRNSSSAKAKKKTRATTTTAAAAARPTSKGRRRRGHTVRQDAATGERYDAWLFERILDSRRHLAGGEDDLEYRVGWTYHRPTWQPAVDLADNPDEIAAFHTQYPAKPGPPGWFTRARGG